MLFYRRRSSRSPRYSSKNTRWGDGTRSLGARSRSGVGGSCMKRHDVRHQIHTRATLSEDRVYVYNGPACLWAPPVWVCSMPRRAWRQPHFRPHSAYLYTAAAAQRSWRAAAAVWLIRLGCYPHGPVPRGTHSPYAHTHTHCTPYQPGIYNTMHLLNYICHPLIYPQHTRRAR